MASMPLQTISEAGVPVICICFRNDRHGMDAMAAPWHDEKVEFSRDAGRALICGQHPDLHFEHGQSAASPPPVPHHSAATPPSCHDLIMASMPFQCTSEAGVPAICISFRNHRHGMDAMVEPWHDEKVEFSQDAGLLPGDISCRVPDR
ncbi:hypothetical protein ACVNHC_08330 [Pannonibacter sp. Q-1]